MKYSDVKLGENYNQEIEEWSVEKHTEQTSTDAYGVINFQGGSHSYRAKACMMFRCFFFVLLSPCWCWMLHLASEIEGWKYWHLYCDKSVPSSILAFLLWFEFFLIFICKRFSVVVEII